MSHVEYVQCLLKARGPKVTLLFSYIYKLSATTSFEVCGKQVNQREKKKNFLPTLVYRQSVHCMW